MRAKNLDTLAIEQIVELINGWTEPLNWEALVNKVERRTHSRYTRQALNKHASIKNAFSARKAELRSSTPARVVRASTPDLEVARATIDALELQLKGAQAQVKRLQAQFVVWAYNAGLKGLDERALNQPLPPTNRGATKYSLEELRESGGDGPKMTRRAMRIAGRSERGKS